MQRSVPFRHLSHSHPSEISDLEFGVLSEALFYYDTCSELSFCGEVGRDRVCVSY